MDAKGKSCILFFIYAAELEFKRQIDSPGFSPEYSWGLVFTVKSKLEFKRP